MKSFALEFLQPDWSAPDNIRAVVTTRRGGYSQAPYEGFNLGGHVQDDPETVRKNRALLREALQLPAEPVWLQQVHSTEVVDAATISAPVKADASFTSQPNVVCTVLTADCLPVFFVALDGSEIAVAHAGWRGLAAGILEKTVQAMSTPAENVLAWLGPAIGPSVFEVGEEVLEVFVAQHAAAEGMFKPRDDKWLADMYGLARLRLKTAGVIGVTGGGECTYSDRERFFSYRRDGETGRMASMIWITPDS